MKWRELEKDLLSNGYRNHTGRLYKKQTKYSKKLKNKWIETVKNNVELQKEYCYDCGKHLSNCKCENKIVK